VNKKFVSHLTQAQRTPSAAATVQVSHALPAVTGFGGLGAACWPLVPKFAGSNPAEAVGFLGRKNSSARLPSEGK